MKLTIKSFYKTAVLTMIAVYSGGSISGSSEISIGEKTYSWKAWDCYDYYNSNHLLSIGYIKWGDLSKTHRKQFISRVKIDKNYNASEIGVLFLKDFEPIYNDYFLRGVVHSWSWDDYAITIKPDGSGYYYDFTGASDGETKESNDTYKCIAR